MRHAALLYFTILLTACTAAQPPVQRMSEAQAAITAAQQKNLPQESLAPAKAAYERARELTATGRYRAAGIAADSALKTAQHLLRQTP